MLGELRSELPGRLVGLGIKRRHGLCGRGLGLGLGQASHAPQHRHGGVLVPERGRAARQRERRIVLAAWGRAHGSARGECSLVFRVADLEHAEPDVVGTLDVVNRRQTDGGIGKKNDDTLLDKIEKVGGVVCRPFHRADVGSGLLGVGLFLCRLADRRRFLVEDGAKVVLGKRRVLDLDRADFICLGPEQCLVPGLLVRFGPGCRLGRQPGVHVALDLVDVPYRVINRRLPGAIIMRRRFMPGMAGLEPGPAARPVHRPDEILVERDEAGAFRFIRVRRAAMGFSRDLALRHPIADEIVVSLLRCDQRVIAPGFCRAGKWFLVVRPVGFLDIATVEFLGLAVEPGLGAGAKAVVAQAVNRMILPGRAAPHARHGTAPGQEAFGNLGDGFGRVDGFFEVFLDAGDGLFQRRVGAEKVDGMEVFMQDRAIAAGLGDVDDRNGAALAVRMCEVEMGGHLAMPERADGEMQDAAETDLFRLDAKHVSQSDEGVMGVVQVVLGLLCGDIFPDRDICEAEGALQLLGGDALSLAHITGVALDAVKARPDQGILALALCPFCVLGLFQRGPAGIFLVP